MYKYTFFKVLSFVGLLFFGQYLLASAAITTCAGQPASTLNYSSTNCTAWSVNYGGVPNCSFTMTANGTFSKSVANGTACTPTLTCTSPSSVSSSDTLTYDPTKIWSGGVCITPAVACNLPWGGTIASGGSVTAYGASSVPFGSSCTSEVRTCNNGTLSGTNANASCVVQPGASCNVAPWGAIAHGASVTAYQSASVMSPATCISESRSCSNGTLVGSYTNSSCTVTSSNCTLPWGGTITTGSNVTAYSSSFAVSPNTCASLAETRTCTASVLSGSFTNSSCSPLSGTLSANPLVCNIDPNAPSCNSTFTWTTTNPVGVSGVFGDKEFVGDTRISNSVLSNSNPSSQLLSVFFSGQVFRLYNNGFELASTTITEVCLNGASNPPLCNAGGGMMTATFNAVPTSCIIPVGTSTCPITLDWNVTNPIGLTTAVTRDGTAGNLYTGHTNPGQIVDVPYKVAGTVIYRLYNNSIEVAPSLSITVGCSGGPTKWDTTNLVCADPQVGSATITGDYGYIIPPETTSNIEFSCINSDRYEVVKDPSGTPVSFASALLPAPGTGLVKVPLFVGGNYSVICKQGSAESIPEIRLFNPPPPPLASIIINATPKTIDMSGQTVLTWSFQYPLPACTLTASPVCSNNICNQSQLDAAAALMTTISTKTTDANDPSGSRPITTAITTYAPGHGTPEFKAMGKKTFDIVHSTNFTIDCGGGVKASTIVRVTNKNEQ